MKTTIKVVFVTIVMLIAMENKLFAQCLNFPATPLTTATGWCRSGNNAANTDRFGTMNAQPLRIFAGGSQQMTILANGNIGIGSTSSNLVGNAGKALTIASDVDGTSSATSLEMWLNTNSITSNSPVIGAMRFFAGTAANQNAIIAARISGTNTATGMLAFYTRPVGSAVAERMRIDENGKIGIGTFSPTSILDVNSNTTGEVFRTTSPVANTAAWRMLTGTGTTAEKFAVILNDPNDPNYPNNPNNVVLQATQPGALMQFNIAGTIGGFGSSPITRMVITDGAYSGNTGLIGMGNGFTTPKSQLHLNDGAFSTYLQITNYQTNNAGAIDPATSDGFKVGIAADGTAELREQENKSMHFYVGNNNANGGGPLLNLIRMTIQGDTTGNSDSSRTQGFVGIGESFTAPKSRLHINDKDSTYAQLTNKITFANPGDGFKIGVKGLNAELKQQENAPMTFATNKTERVLALLCLNLFCI